MYSEGVDLAGGGKGIVELLGCLVRDGTAVRARRAAQRATRGDEREPKVSQLGAKTALGRREDEHVAALQVVVQHRLRLLAVQEGHGRGSAGGQFHLRSLGAEDLGGRGVEQVTQAAARC